MGGVYVLSPFGPIFIVKSVQGGGGFSSGHKWGILGGHQGMKRVKNNKNAEVINKTEIKLYQRCFA